MPAARSRPTPSSAAHASGPPLPPSSATPATRTAVQTNALETTARRRIPASVPELAAKRSTTNSTATLQRSFSWPHSWHFTGLSKASSGSVRGDAAEPGTKMRRLTRSGATPPRSGRDDQGAALPAWLQSRKGTQGRSGQRRQRERAPSSGPFSHNSACSACWAFTKSSRRTVNCMFVWRAVCETPMMLMRARAMAPVA
jgi:hypothetical protein